MAEQSLKDIGPVVLVGAGKMGLAMARGWIAGGLPPDRLVLVDPFAGEPAQAFAQETGARLLKSADGVLTHVLVLAVKPQNMIPVLQQVLPVVGKHTLVISIAAGISLHTLAAGLDTERVVRAMPNTPAQLGKGITGAVGLSVSEADQEVANLLLRAAGDVAWFEAETMIDAVTYVHRIIGLPLEEALRMASLYPAEALGVDKERGRIAPGLRADLVHLSDELSVRGTLIGGETAYAA
ncbi:MAG: NAD(P)-binding domain-containing protein [Devosia sp.]|nr:NAD(P)-binding domain-containing protein [Devosia sp.]